MVGDVFDCGDTVYTITSGTVKFVEHVTEAANVNTDTGPATFTVKLQFIGAGGKADSVNVTFHVSPNGDVNEFDFGTWVF